MKLYKALNVDGSACHGGSGSWSLPEGDQPGEWMPNIEGEIIPCKNGYHLCREGDLLTWLGQTIFEAECEGEIVECKDKVVVRKARLVRQTAWNDKTARLFAADCAERVLHIFENAHQGDDRPRRAIEAARAYANGRIDRDQLSGAWDAAWDAVKDAGIDVVRVGTYAWVATKGAEWPITREAAEAAVWTTAKDIAEGAQLSARSAKFAEYGAARDAERKWQTERLMQYLSGEAR